MARISPPTAGAPGPTEAVAPAAPESGPVTGGPYKAELLRAVEAAYDAFGRGHVSAQLEVCLCPVCMSEAARAATRNCERPVFSCLRWVLQNPSERAAVCFACGIA